MKDNSVGAAPRDWQQWSVIVPPNEDIRERFGPWSSYAISLEAFDAERRRLMETGVPASDIEHAMDGYQRVRYRWRQFRNSREIRVAVRAYSISEIDTVKQQFTADLLVDASLRIPEPLLQSLIKSGSGESAVYSTSSDWDEETAASLLAKVRKHVTIRFVNAVNMKGEDIEWWVSKWDPRTPVINLRARARSITFCEPLELQHFPFDQQALSIRLTLDQRLDLCHFTQAYDNQTHKPRNSIVADDYAFRESEWKLFKKLYSYTGTTDPSDSASATVYPIFVVSAFVERQWLYYVANYYFVMFIVTTIAGTAFAISPDQVSERLSIVVTMLLTAVALKFVVSQNVPKVSYQTHLDQYILLCFVMMALVAGQTAVSGSIESVRPHDTSLAIAAGALWGCINLYSFVTALRVLLPRRVAGFRSPSSAPREGGVSDFAWSRGHHKSARAYRRLRTVPSSAASGA